MTVLPCETLTWHPAANPPDADQTVLLWAVWPDGETNWESGWWDGEAWRLCESGGLCSGMVTHYAMPEGPAA